MTDPAQRCVHCGARFDSVGTSAGAWPGDPDTEWERREWVDPEPRDALDVLRLANAEQKP